MGEDILYRLHKECEFETLETNDNYINSIFKNAEKYYSFPDTINGMEIKQMLPLGNFAFYILNYENLNFDKDILSKLKLINEFLSKCIINKELCNNKVFLAFIRDILKLQKFPQGNIYVSNYYTETDNVNLDMENKLKLMLNNIKNITYLDFQAIYASNEGMEIILSKTNYSKYLRKWSITNVVSTLSSSVYSETLKKYLHVNKKVNEILNEEEGADNNE